jgi:hypothetical protein
MANEAEVLPPLLTNASPARNAPQIDASASAARAIIGRSLIEAVLASSTTATPISARPRVACTVSANGAVAISCIIPAPLSDAGTCTYRFRNTPMSYCNTSMTRTATQARRTAATPGGRLCRPGTTSLARLLAKATPHPPGLASGKETPFPCDTSICSRRFSYALWQHQHTIAPRRPDSAATRPLNARRVGYPELPPTEVCRPGCCWQDRRDECCS